MNSGDPLEKLLWSVALPGFGQFLNQKYFKGIVLVILEFLINNKSNLNKVIILSFQGHTHQAIQQTDFHWLMFYPCVYMFAIWDAFRDAGGSKSPFSYLPFILAAFLGTVGLIYSSIFTVNGFLLGPVWLPMVFAFIGIGLGIFLKRLIQ